MLITVSVPEVPGGTCTTLNARRYAYGYYDSIFLAQASKLLRTDIKYIMGGHPRLVKYCSWPKFQPRISRRRVWQK